jgi:hypothetical protein
MRAAAGDAVPAPGPIAQMGSRNVINALFGPESAPDARSST